MPLINFQTDLTNLPWGRDKRGGGDSNQPYITKEIPKGLESDDLPVRSGPDFIVRGGLKMVTNAVDDVSRLFKMFIDTKNLSAGIGFIVKQNILSRTSVKTPASFGLGYAGSRDYYFEDGINGLAATGGGNINQGVYTPISTLAQAVGNGLGLHANLLGIDPFSPMSGVVEGSLFSGGLDEGLSLLGLNTYEAATKKFNETSDGNKLVIFNNRANERGTDNDQNIYSYGGGPGSILGIGKTNIRFADQRTGLANANGSGIEAGTYQVGLAARTWTDQIQGLVKGDFSGGGEYASSKYLKSFPMGDQAFFANSDSLFYDVNGEAIVIGKEKGWTQNFPTSVNSLFSGSVEINPSVLYKNNSRTYNLSQIADSPNVIGGNQAGLDPTDFRKNLYTASTQDILPPTEDPLKPFEGGSQKSSVLSVSPNYRTKNIDSRLNMGQPGKSGGGFKETFDGSKNVWNYSIAASQSMALDKMTANPMYVHTNGADGSRAINDSVKFRIAAIDNNNPSQAVYMHFRAFIDSMDDNYTSTWNPVNYAGRGDTLYNYGGFNRTMNLSFTVAAQSKAELIPMYKKLNYLASTLAPSYNSSGFMRGNLVRLTIGGYVYEQPGFITSLTYTVPEASPWEIAINSEGTSDRSVQELPHVIQVTGFSFTPIHTFLPSKPEGVSKEETEALANNPLSTEVGSNNGNQRFISLARGISDSSESVFTSYNDKYPTYEPNTPSDGDNQSITEE